MSAPEDTIMDERPVEATSPNAATTTIAADADTEMTGNDSVERTPFITIPDAAPHISTLSTDLLNAIFALLDPVASICLGLTCKRFYTMHKILHTDPIPLNTCQQFHFQETRQNAAISLATYLVTWMPQDMAYYHRRDRDHPGKFVAEDKVVYLKKMDVRVWREQVAKSQEYRKEVLRRWQVEMRGENRVVEVVRELRCNAEEEFDDVSEDETVAESVDEPEPVVRPAVDRARVGCPRLKLRLIVRNQI